MSNDDSSASSSLSSSDIGDATHTDGGLAASDDEAVREGSFSDPRGFGGRLANSFGAIIVGLILIPISCFLLFWNEGRAVRTARALDEGLGIAKTIATDRLDSALNGQLVHVAGETRSATPIADADLGVSQKSLKLERIVEMYQWKESESGSGNDRKYNYSRVWDDDPIASSRFKFRSGHENPTFPSYRSRQFGAADAKIGAFPVGEEATSQLATDATLRIDELGLAKARQVMGARTVVANGGYFLGDPANPRVGDVRVTYKIAREGPASFVGVQNEKGLTSYRAKNGESFLLAGSGVKSSAELFKTAQDENSTLTWILRAVGLVLMLIGFSLLFAPVNLLASYVPILGSMVAGGIMLIAGVATLLLGPLVIAIAWFWYRPIVSIVVLGLGIAAAYGLRQWRASRKPARMIGARPRPV